MTNERERKVLDHLIGAWNAFLELDDHHPDDLGEFRFSLHHLQMMIAWRVARRVDPQTWGLSDAVRAYEERRSKQRQEDIESILACHPEYEPASLDKMSDELIEIMGRPYRKFSDTL